MTTSAEQTAQGRTGGYDITLDLLERLRTFGRMLEHCADEDLRSAYDAEIGAAIEPSVEARCFAGLCVAEAKRRGLVTADWPALVVAVPIGPDEEVAAAPVTDEEEGA
jgi:hypothetical protein